MGSVACVAELQSMGPELVSVEQKRNLAWGTYFPYALIRKFLLFYLWRVLLMNEAGLMAVDMYMRLLRRVSNDAKPKTQ